LEGTWTVSMSFDGMEKRRERVKSCLFETRKVVERIFRGECAGNFMETSTEVFTLHHAATSNFPAQTIDRKMLRRLNVFKCSSAIKFSGFAGIVASSRVKRIPVKMQEDYVTINSVPTHIFTFGKWIEDKFEEKDKEMVLIVTGNPGEIIREL
jgi:hypothetical protein